LQIHSRELLAFAVLGTLAFAVEDQIYARLIVPRLPDVPRVPLWWWLGESAAPLLVFLAAGWFGASAQRVVLLCVAAFLPWFALSSLYAWLVDVPIGHDVWVGDPAFWFGTGIQLGFWLLVACGAAAGRWALRRVSIAA